MCVHGAGTPKATLAPLTSVWTQLSWQVEQQAQECLQILAYGRGQINLDDASIKQTATAAAAAQ